MSCYINVYINEDGTKLLEVSYYDGSGAKESFDLELPEGVEIELNIN